MEYKKPNDMTNVFTCLMKKKFGNGNGSGMDRDFIGNGSAKSRKLFAVLAMMLTIGVQGAWGYTGTFTKITSVDDLNTGYYVIVASESASNASYAMSSEITSNSSNYRVSSSSVTITGGTTISNPADAVVYYIEKTNTGYAVKNYSTDKYLYQSSTSTQKMAFRDEKIDMFSSVFYCNWHITDNVTGHVIGFCFTTNQSGDNTIFRYNNSSMFFTNYSGGWSTSGAPLRLFRLNNAAHTVSFNAEGGTCGTSSSIEGSLNAGISLPSATPSAGCVTDGWEFAGWKKVSAQTETTTSPTLYTAGSTFYPIEDLTLHAVYQFSEDLEECDAKKLTNKDALAIGDKVILVYDGSTPKIQYKGVKTVSSTDVGDTLRWSSSPAEVHVLDVQEGYAENTFAFYDETDRVYLSWSTGNSLTEATSITSASSWTVTLNVSGVTIANYGTSTRKIKFNSDRIACYESTPSAMQLYRICPPTITYNSNPSCAPSCEAPTSPGKSSIVSDGFTAGWTAPSSAPEDGYIVAYASVTDDTPSDDLTSSSGSYTVVSSATTSKAISSLTGGTTYYWWVRSKCGESDYSDWVDGPSVTIPKITASPTTITGLDYEVESGPSAAQSFTFSGVALNSGSITVTAPTNFEVSKDGSSFADSKTFTIPGNGTPVDSTVYVRLKSSLSAATYGPSNVTISGGGASTVNVSVKGIVTPKLSSISVTTQPTKTAYFAGEDFDATGMVVTATYADASTANVTASCSFTGNTSMSAGGSVTISYGGKTTSPSINVYSVTVQKQDEDGTTISADGVTAGCSVKSLSASATAASKYVFKGWKYGTAAGTSISDNTSASTTLTGTPTGNVTVIAEFYKPVTITWLVNGEDADAGEQTLSVAHGTLWSALTAPSDPDDDELDCADTFVGWSNTMSAGTEWYDCENHSVPGTLVTDFSEISTAITAPITFKAVFATHVDGLADKTIIEDFEKQTASQSYNSTQNYTTDDSNIGVAWTTYYGCVSTTGALIGTNSAQMRLYSTANYGYVTSTTALLSLSSLKFRARVSNTDVKMDVAYSTDGTNWTNVATKADVNTTKSEYSYSIPGASSTNYYIRISINSESTRPSSGSNYQFYVDSVALTYKAATVTYKDYCTKCCTALEDVNASVSWPSVGTARVSWDDSEHASAWTVKYRTGSAAYGTSNVGDQSTSAGRRSVDITSLTCGTKYDIKIIPTPVTGYKAEDIDIEEERAKGYDITLYNSGTIVDEDVTLGTFDADVSDQCAEDEILLAAYPNPGYVIDEWVITKTSDGTDITDADGVITDGAKTDDMIEVTQPAYPITVKATFKDDLTPRIALSQTSTYAFSTVNQYTTPTSMTFTVNAANLDSDVKIELSGTGASAFSLDKSSITPTDGKVTDVEVTVSTVTSAAGTFSATVTVQDKDKDASAQSFNVTLTVTPVYDITWKVNGKALSGLDLGSASTRVVTGSKVSKLPPPPADNTLNSCANMFMGWTTENIGSTPENDPEIIELLELFTDAEDAPTVSDNVTYYAVFAERDAVAGRVEINTTNSGVGDSYQSTTFTVDEIEFAYNNWKISTNIQAASSKKLSVRNNDAFPRKIRKVVVKQTGTARAVVIDGKNYVSSAAATAASASYDSARITSPSTAATMTFYFPSNKDYRYFSMNTPSNAVYMDSIVIYYGDTTYSNYVTECDGTTARVTYSANGGTGMDCSSGVYTRAGFKTCDTPPTKIGYTFAGWSDGTNTHAADASFTLTQDTTFTASWNAINYDIHYNLNEGTGVSDRTYTIEDDAIVLPTPTRNEGHDRFEGWFDNEELTGDPVTTIESGSTGTKEFWASWTTRYHVEFYKEDSRVVEIWRAADEDISATVAGQGTKPSDPSTPTLCGSKVFVGWSGSTIDLETDTKPADLKSTAKGFVTSDTIVHTVWATKTSNTPPGTYTGTGVFERITELSEMTTGTYYVLYGVKSGTTGALSNSITSQYAAAVEVTVSNNKITDPGTAIVWKLGGTTDAYTLYNQAASGYIEITTAASNGYAMNSPATTSYTVSYTDAKGFFFKSNHASAGPRGISIGNTSNYDFRSYIEANLNELQLYKWPEYLYSDYSTYCFNTFNDGNSTHTWNDEDNWSGDVPGISERVLIQKPVTVDIVNAKAKEVILDQQTGNSGKLEISAGQALVVAESVKKTTDGETLSATAENDIIIGSSASGNGALVMGGHDGTNKATVYFYSLAKKETTEGKANWYNQHIGTPFSSGRGVLYDYYESYLYSWDAENQKWVNIKDGSTHFTPFLGYNVLRKSSTPGTFEMEGTLVESETQVLNLTYNEGELKDNENVLANSWTAPIDIVAIGSESFYHCQATIYIMNAGGPEDIASAGEGAVDAANPAQWIVLPLASVPWTSQTLTKIPPMQGFSVYATGADPTLTLNYGTAVYTPALTNATPPPTRAPKRTQDEDPEVMHLRVEAESGYADVVCMLIREDFSDEFENGWDGTKIFGQAIAPQLYAFSAGGNMAVNCIDNAEGTVLGFRKGSDDNRYTFSFSYDGDEMWYLNDQLEQKSTLINNDRTYDFYADESDTEARFVISRSPISKTPTGIGGGEAGSGEVRKLLINNHVYIVRNGKIYHVDGGLIR